MKKTVYLLLMLLLFFICGCSHSHQFKENIVLPTCLTEGYTEHKCDCGEVVIDNYVSPLGHEEVVVSGKDATCTNTGLTEGSRCSRCNEVLLEKQEIPLLEHNVVVDESKEPTCTNTGLTEGSQCSI